MEPWVWTLICLGLAFLFAFLEIFVTSGGILAFLASAILLGSVVFAFWEGPLFGSVYTLGMVIGVPILLWYALKYWPRSIMGRRVLLNPDEDPALAPDLELLALKKFVGKRGTARSKMMLSGLIEIGGKRINAVSDSEPIEPGDSVVVVSVDGVNVLVRKVFEESSPIAEPMEREPTSIEDPFA